MDGIDKFSLEITRGAEITEPCIICSARPLDIGKLSIFVKVLTQQVTVEQLVRPCREVPCNRTNDR